MPKLCLVPLLTLGILFSCQFPVLGPAKSDRSLTVSWGLTSGARTIAPASYPTVATYDVVLHPNTGSSGDVSQTGLNTTNWTFSNLPAVVFTITVTGKDSGGSLVVKGTGTADLTASSPVNPTILLYYIASGPGTGQIHLTFNNAYDVTTTSIAVVDPSGTTLGAALVPDSSNPVRNFTYTSTAAAVGSYKLFVSFATLFGTASITESVLVVQNVDTVHTTTLATTDYGDLGYTAVSSLSLSPASATLSVGGTQPLSPILNPGASNGLLTWTTSNPSAVAINQNGLATALAPGNSTITATSVDNPSVFGTATLTVAAAAPLATWAEPLVTATADTYGFALASDPSGNVWTGGIQGSVPLLMKFNTTGTLQTTVPFSTTAGGAGIYGVTTDSSGNVYAVGGVVYPDATIAGVTVNPGWSAGPTVMIVKLDSSGAFQWLHSIASAPYSSYYQGVAVDNANGLVYAGGRDMNNFTYDFEGGITNASGVSGLFNNFLVVQYTTSGFTQWARTPSAGSDSSWVQGLAANSSGVWAAGWITGNLPFTISGASFTGATTGDNLALVRFDRNGYALWATTSGVGTSAGSASHFNAVAVDSSQNVYAAGYVAGTGTLDLGNGVTVTPVNWTSPTANNLLLVKYDPSGLAQWARSVSTTNGSASVLTSVTVEPSGKILVGGYITGSGTYPLGNGVFVAAASGSTVTNALVAEYDASGNAQWAHSMGNADPTASQVTGVAAGPSGNLYATGYATPLPSAAPFSLAFGNGVFASENYAGFNPFLVQYH